MLDYTWLLKLNHGAYSHLLFQLASIAAASTYYLWTRLSHASAHIVWKYVHFFLPVSRLPSKLTDFIYFLVLGCMWLLKLNHSAYLHLLFQLASIAAATTYYLEVGSSHARTHIFPKHVLFFLPASRLASKLTDVILLFGVGLYLATQIKSRHIFIPVASASFCSNSKDVLPVGGFEPCLCPHFQEICTFFLPVSRLASDWHLN